jgi:hypothetical protein
MTVLSWMKTLTVLPPSVLVLGDRLQRRKPDQRVGAHPERRIEPARALVDQVLDVGGGAGDALDGRIAVREGQVGRLGDAGAGIALQHVDQRGDILAEDDAVGVERQHVVGLRDVVVDLRADRGLQAGDAVAVDAHVASAHQADIGVEVHRLVRRVRQVGEDLALEVRDVVANQDREARIFGVDLVRRQFRRGEALGAGQVARGCVADDAFDDEAVDMAEVLRSFRLEARRQRIQPLDHAAVALRQAPRLAVRVEGPGRPAREPVVAFAAQALGLLADPSRDFADRGKRRPDGVHVRGRIVDEHDDPPIGVFGERGGQNRPDQDAPLLAVGRYQDRDRRRVLRRPPGDLRGGGAVLFFPAPRGAEAIELVGEAAIEQRHQHGVVEDDVGPEHAQGAEMIGGESGEHRHRTGDGELDAVRADRAALFREPRPDRREYRIDGAADRAPDRAEATHDLRDRTPKVVPARRTSGRSSDVAGPETGTASAVPASMTSACSSTVMPRSRSAGAIRS